MASSFNIRELILSGIRGFSYSFTSRKYPETESLKIFLDWIFAENKIEKVKPQRKYYAGQVVRDLIKEKIIIFDRDKGFTLTVNGKLVQARYELEGYKISKSNKWDGKYRVIIFDIAEQKRRLRGELRNLLIRAGFIRLQNSVWVYPYECQEFVSLIKAALGVVADVVYMEVSWIENDKWLKKEFGLQ